MFTSVFVGLPIPPLDRCHQRNYAVNKKHITNGRSAVGLHCCSPVSGSGSSHHQLLVAVLSCGCFSCSWHRRAKVFNAVHVLAVASPTALLAVCPLVCLSIRLSDSEFVSVMPLANIYSMFIGTHFALAACLIAR